MAVRTRAEIYNDLTADIQTNTELTGLLPNPDNWTTLFTEANFKLLANTIVKGLSVSGVAIWRLIAYVVSYALYTVEVLVDSFTTDIDTLTKNREYGQIPWIVQKVKEFQYGDALVWNDNGYYEYETIDESKRIVTQCAINVTNGQIIIKVAKGEVGSLEPLSASEKSALQLYLTGTSAPFVEDGILPPTSAVLINSLANDDLKFAAKIYYDPTMFNSDGTLIADSSTPVQDAIREYIQFLPFNAKFQLSSLKSVILAIDGIENVTFSACDARQGSTTFSNLLLLSDEAYTAVSGYLNMASGHDLDEYYDDLNTIPTLQFISYN